MGISLPMASGSLCHCCQLALCCQLTLCCQQSTSCWLSLLSSLWSWLAYSRPESEAALPEALVDLVAACVNAGLLVWRQ